MLKIELKVRIVLLVVLLSFGGLRTVSGQMVECKAFHKGIFYVYQATSGNRYVIYRDDKMEREVVAGKGDSTVWNIEWLDDCNYTLQYISGNVPLTGRQANFVKKHKLFYHLVPAGKDYCIYLETIDGPSGILVEKDTMRLHETLTTVDSSSAFLFIYRPGKLALAPSIFNLYLGDSLLCVVKNNSGYMFTLTRQGAVILRSQVNRDTCVLPIEIRFGMRYYVRATMDWGYYHGKNYKLVLEAVPAGQGEKEFRQTRFPRN